MTWVRVEPDAALHPKYFRAGCGAFGFDVAAWGYCNRHLTDGFIPRTDLGLIFPGTPMGRALKWVAALVEVGRWEVTAGGWRIKDFHHYQPTKAEILEERHLHALRSQAGGRARASVADRIKGRFASRATSQDTSQSPAARLVGAGEVAGEALDQPQPASDQPRSRTVSVTVPVPKRQKQQQRVVLTDDQFIESLRLNAAYQHLDIAQELGRMDAWLSAHPGRQKTRRFIVAWLNRQEKPLASGNGSHGNPRAVNDPWKGKTEAREVKLK